jgi:5-methylcytosine-specific restriction enzyme subunit McrC
MMAYARLYACPRLVLLYPARPGEVTHEISSQGIPPGRDRLDVATIPLDRSADEIRFRLGRMILNGS